MKNIIDKFKTLFYKYKSQVLYLFFGGLSTFLNIIIFFLLNTLVKIDYQISNVIAWIIVVVFAYITNKIWVFESKTTSKKDLLKESLSFIIARVVTLIVEFILLYLFIEKFLMIEIVAKIIINVIVVVLNYIFSKLFIFNTNKQFDIKKLITPLIIFFILVSVISLMLYKYEISGRGYDLTFSKLDNISSESVEYLLGRKEIIVSNSSVIKQDFLITNDNAQYMNIYFNEYEDEFSQSYYKIEIIDIDNNVLIEKEINEKYVYKSVYKLDISTLSKGNYTLILKYSGDNKRFVPTYNTSYGGSFYVDDVKQNGNLDIAIFYKQNDKYLMLYSAILFFTILYLLILFILHKYKNITLQKKFLILAIPIYLIYLVLIPPLGGHDEREHWYRIFEITEGGLTSDVDGNKTGYVLPKGVVLNIPWLSTFRYSSIIKNKQSIIDYSDTEFKSNATMAVYSPVQYLPQIVGVIIGKTVTNNSLIIFYLGRIFNMISCLIILYLAIKKTPYFKKMMFLLAFIPIAIEGFTTLTGDGILIAVSYYFLAYILALFEMNRKLNKKDFIILLVLGTFLAFSKLIYIPLIGLLLLIPKTKFKNNKDKIIKLSIIFLILISINIFWLNIANKYLEVYTLGKSKAQISFILSNPFKYFQIFLYSIESNGIDLILQTFGKYLLWGEELSNETLVPLTLIITSIILIINEKNKKLNCKSSNIILTLISLVIIALIFTSIFIQWTRYGTDIMYGVQGRYFLPILPLILILLSNIVKYKANLKEHTLDKIVIYVCLFVNYMTMLELVVNYL